MWTARREPSNTDDFLLCGCGVGVARPRRVARDTPLGQKAVVQPRDERDGRDQGPTLGVEPRHGRQRGRLAVVNPHGLTVLDDFKLVVRKGVGEQHGVRDVAVVHRMRVPKRSDEPHPRVVRPLQPSHPRRVVGGQVA